MESYNRSSLVFHSLVTSRSYNRSARSDKWIQLAKCSFNRTVTESLVETNGFHIKSGCRLCFYHLIFSLFSLDLIFIQNVVAKSDVILKILKIRNFLRIPSITNYVSLIPELSKLVGIYNFPLILLHIIFIQCTL